MNTEEPVRIEKEELRMLFDLVVGSMDFGSGFLVTEDVELMRRIAVVLGVDPMTATPRSFMKSYPHDFELQKPEELYWPEEPWCRRCSGAADHPVHARVTALEGGTSA